MFFLHSRAFDDLTESADPDDIVIIGVLVEYNKTASMNFDFLPGPSTNYKLK
jgi:hypothetical protein